MKYYTLKVIDLRKESADACTVIFKQPALKKLKYSSGQYLTLIFKINGRRYIRPYSFSSAPLVDPHLEVTVKRVSGGLVSNHILDKLKIDDLVEVMEPMGDFTLDVNMITPESHLVLWGAGSGITPLISLVKYALHQNMFGQISLIYGNRRTEDVLFKDLISQLKQQHPNFTAWHFYTKLVIASNNPYLIEGRIDPNKVLSILRHQADLSQSIHYICGPVGMKESVISSLRHTGVKQENVYTEDFEIVRDPQAFEDIITRTVTIDYQGTKTPVEVVKGKSILEAGLDTGVDLSYSCQTGNCLVCRCVLNEGEVKMIGINKTPVELNANECLLCCSFPLTDNVKVSVE
jgi:ring-1,2-phenylacetyl-CoA epoxidase subunit PaaE